MLKSLKAGHTVAVVATAKRLEKPVDKGIEVLESWGLNVLKGKYLNSQHEYFAGSDKHRLEDLQRVLDDEDVKAVIFARGGYGTTKILDQLDFTKFRKQPKWLVGFSDLTSILLQVSSLNVHSIHGPMVYTLGQDKVSDDLLKALLFGEKTITINASEANLQQPGEIIAEITGGNLSLIYESLGCENEIQTEGRVLFLEEIGEELYAIDRMLNKLKRAGKFDSLKGVILGNFSSIKDRSGYFHTSIGELLMSYFQQVDGPIIQNFPSGHEQRNLPIILNQKMKLTAGERHINFEYLD